MKYRFALLVLLCGSLSAQTYTFSALFNMAKAKTGPRNPGPPIVDSTGNVYAASSQGGTTGLGTIFRVTKAGKMSVLHSFGTTSTDGTVPWNIVRDTAGNIYGSTGTGGSQLGGVIYKVASTGTETIIYSFAQSFEQNAIFRDTSGNFYGYADGGGYGNVFELSAAGEESTLFSFCIDSPCDAAGSSPQGTPIKNKSGMVYGVTYSGAAQNCGSVFQLDSTGALSTLYSFLGSTDGCGPFLKPIQDSASNVYGVTNTGGAAGEGTVFKVTSQGTETTLYSFPAGTPAESSLVQDSKGNLFGIAGTGSSSYVYMITSTGVVSTVLQSPGPSGLGFGLAIDTAGNLYGTQSSGGPAHYGAVYKLTKH